MAKQTLREVELNLKSRHVDYLRSRSLRNQTTLSSSFRTIIDERATHMLSEAKQGTPSTKSPMGLSLREDQISLLDALAMQLGVWRVEVARRLIDEAMAEDALMSSLDAHTPAA